MKTTIAIALALGALALSAGPSLAGTDAPTLELFVIEMAQTPAQHTALAQYYRGKAADARSEQSRHEQMAKGYGAKRVTQQMRMKEHCQAIVKDLADMAKTYDEMATEHENEAKTK